MSRRHGERVSTQKLWTAAASLALINFVLLACLVVGTSIINLYPLSQGQPFEVVGFFPASNLESGLRLLQSCNRIGLICSGIEKVTSFDSGSHNEPGIRDGFIPQYLLTSFRRFGFKQPLLLVDRDLEFLRYPEFLHNVSPDIDVLVLPSLEDGEPFSGGVSYWNPTEKVQRLLEAWEKRLRGTKGPQPLQEQFDEMIEHYSIAVASFPVSFLTVLPSVDAHAVLVRN